MNVVIYFFLYVGVSSTDRSTFCPLSHHCDNDNCYVGVLDTSNDI